MSTQVTRPLTAQEIGRLVERHHEQVMCSSCKEWTEFGESCCGQTQCESDCPVCIEEGYV